MSKNLNWAYFISILVLLGGCGGTKDLGEQSLVESFTKGATELGIQYRVFHINKDSSAVYMKLETDRLLYSKMRDGTWKASCTIHFSPHALHEESHSVESKIVRVEDVSEDGTGKVLLASTVIPLTGGFDYEMTVTITDENRKKSQTNRFFCSKKDPNSRLNFLGTEKGAKAPLFQDRIVAGKSYEIESGQDLNSIFVRYYNREFPLPPPPFVDYTPDPFNYQADSSFVLSNDSLGKFNFTADSSGFYHFQSDTTDNSTKGYTLFVSSVEFPYVTRIENMIDPFRYLVGRKDYETVDESINSRAALEEFWIQWSGSKEIARKAIKNYYSRVEEANRLFSCHVEGWKSDRGIIFCVYGKPNKVYYKKDVETWIYGEEGNPLSVTFTFVQVINPFTSNDYRMVRSEVFKPSWYHSLKACREGKIQ